MAAYTYKKPLKAFQATTLMAYTINAPDNPSGDRLGTYAIEAFEGKKTIKAMSDDATVLVPFHAVQKAMYVTMTANTEKADAYCEGDR